MITAKDPIGLLANLLFIKFFWREINIFFITRVIKPNKLGYLFTKKQENQNISLKTSLCFLIFIQVALILKRNELHNVINED